VFGHPTAKFRERLVNPLSVFVSDALLLLVICKKVIIRTHKEGTVSVYEGITKNFRTESITKQTPTTINTRSEATQRVMEAKLTRLTHKIAIKLHLVAESCTICSSRSMRPVRKRLDKSSLPASLCSSVKSVGPHVPPALQLTKRIWMKFSTRSATGPCTVQFHS
jgi:hypothetical protein